MNITCMYLVNRILNNIHVNDFNTRFCRNNACTVSCCLLFICILFDFCISCITQLVLFLFTDLSVVTLIIQISLKAFCKSSRVHMKLSVSWMLICCLFYSRYQKIIDFFLSRYLSVGHLPSSYYSLITSSK